MSGVYYILMNKNNGLSKICYRIVEKSTGRGFLGIWFAYGRTTGQAARGKLVEMGPRDRKMEEQED